MPELPPKDEARFRRLHNARRAPVIAASRRGFRNAGIAALLSLIGSCVISHKGSPFASYRRLGDVVVLCFTLTFGLTMWFGAVLLTIRLKKSPR